MFKNGYYIFYFISNRHKENDHLVYEDCSVFDCSKELSKSLMISTESGNKETFTGHYRQSSVSDHYKMNKLMWLICNLRHYQSSLDYVRKHPPGQFNKPVEPWWLFFGSGSQGRRNCHWEEFFTKRKIFFSQQLWSRRLFLLTDHEYFHLILITLQAKGIFKSDFLGENPGKSAPEVLNKWIKKTIEAFKETPNSAIFRLKQNDSPVQIDNVSYFK